MSEPQRGNDERVAGVNRWAGICERLTAALRGWPTSEIEHGVRLLFCRVDKTGGRTCPLGKHMRGRKPGLPIMTR